MYQPLEEYASADGAAPIWNALWAGRVVPIRGRRYIVARPTDNAMRMEFAFFHGEDRWTLDAAGELPLGFSPQWFGGEPAHPPFPPPEHLPLDHPWRTS
jgi:hypothetical protein